ncbi:UPF0182 family membrane protein [Austwickia chelonae]|uniref:UPF0182 family membrane protein n=1 Tax=Austwickia chelonae TaxID=100225 RepID=UPI001F08029F|nr:UPF0182 family protein [Austwickia chelonae]
MSQQGFDGERGFVPRASGSASPGGPSGGDQGGSGRPGDGDKSGGGGGFRFGFGGFAGGPGAGGSGSGGPQGPRKPGSGGPRMPHPQMKPWRPSPLAVTGLVLVVVMALAVFGSFVWTQLMWFQSLGYSSVFWTQIGSQVALFLGGMVIAGAVVASSLVLGYRMRPVYAPASQREQVLDRYREMLDPVRKAAIVAVPLVLGAFGGLAAASQWKVLLLYLNGQPFGKTDPTFGKDVGFFVFDLPWYLFLESFFTMSLVLAVMAAVVTHYVYGGLAVGANGVHTSKSARVHLAVLAGAFVLVRAVGYWLDRYQLAVTSSSRITGLQYTEANAVLWTKGILAGAAVICALLFLSSIWTRSWRYPMTGLGILVVVSLVVGNAYPAAIQAFKVKPSEQSLEAPYLQHNINATRAAYGLDQIDRKPYEAKKVPDKGGLSGDAATIPGVRVVDPMVVSSTFMQLQGLRRYYQFPDVLDVDRYTIDGKRQDTVIAARELDLASAPSRSWVNDHTVYTHGYGLVAAYGTQRDARGEPVFFAKDIPMVGKLGEFEPRIYFGEKTHTYSIVGEAPGVQPRELDYQSDQGESRTTFSGNGGVKMDNIFKRLAYAVKYREYNILLSEQVGDHSVMLDHRTPKERIERVAPWLTLDGNPYPAVVDGRVQWIVDGYTTSAHYPYSQLQSIDTATTDAVTRSRQSVQEIRAGQVNYIRNSVKATVDAYDGSVKLYAWDDQDPMLKAWSSAFGGTVKPMNEISGALMSHLRYPEDMFKVQRELLSRYHVTDASAFYSGSDYWKVPTDPTAADQKAGQPPYYLSIGMPGQKDPAFSLTTSFTPAGENRQFLTGFLAVDSDAGDEKGKRRDGYGKMRLLELPANTNIMGPAQVQNQISTSNQNSTDFSVTLSQFINLNQGGSTAQKGNLLTLPVGGGLLYVQPIYISGKAGTSYPLNQAIVVSFGDKLAWGATLESALNQLFGGDSGAKTDQPAPSTPGKPPTDNTPPNPSAELKALLAEAQKAYSEGQEALKKGDFTAYGTAQKKLQEAIEKATKTSGQLPSTPEGTPPAGK